MGLQTIPAYIGVAAFLNPVENDRNVLKSMFGRTGLLRPGAFKVTPTGTARQVSAAAGAAILLGTENSTQGAYQVWSDAAELYTFAAAVGNPRIDTLVMRVIDEQYGADPGDSRSEIEIVQGVAAGSPVARADSYFNTGGAAYKAGAWYRIADVRINVVDGVLPAGQITETLQYVRTAGRTVCTSTTRPSDAVAGDSVYETDTKKVLYYDGTSWGVNYGRFMGSFTQTSSTLSSGSETMGPSVTFNAVAGHTYQVSYDVAYGGDTSMSMKARMRHATGASVTTSGTQFRMKSWTMDNGANTGPVTLEGSFTAATTGQMTVGVSIQRLSGSGSASFFCNADSEGYLRVIDVT